MRIPTRAIPRLALIGLIGAFAVSAAPASADVPQENALPGSTLALLKINDTAAMREAAGNSQFGQLLADPAMQPLKADIEVKLEDFNRELKQRIGVTIAELLETPQGPAWLAITRQEAELPFAVLIAADAGENQAQMQEIMTKGTSELREQDGEVSTEEFQGLTLTVIKAPDEEQAPPLVWTNQESVYFIGTDVDAIKDLIANADGREDSLAANANYTAIQGKLDNDAHLSWFIDIGQVLRLVTQAGAEAGGDAQQVEARLQLFGINGLRAAGGCYTLTTGEYDSIAKTIIYAPGPPQGVLRIFQMPVDALPVEPWVPAETASYQTLSWDLDAAYVALNDLVNMFLPGTLDNVERELGGLRFQQDIFGPLGNRITVVTDFKQPIDEDSQRALFAIALDDAQTFQNTLTKVIDLAGAAPKRREFQGTTIYDFELPNLPNPAGGPEGFDFDGLISVAIAQEYLFVTTDTTLLEQVLRPGAANLSESAEFQSIRKQIPEQVSSFSYNRPDEQARAVYNMVKGGQLDQILEGANMAGVGNAPKLSDFIDVDKIPEFSVFAKYLTESGGYSVMDEDGLTLIQFTLRKNNP
ncbi:hypothetical protein BH23PLA1_BH23PLA1_41410 [soil metagenome]